MAKPRENALVFLWVVAMVVREKEWEALSEL